MKERKLPKLYPAAQGEHRYRLYDPLKKKPDWRYIRKHEFDGSEKDARRVQMEQMGLRPEQRLKHTNERYLHYALRVVNEIPSSHITDKCRENYIQVIEDHHTPLHAKKVNAIQFEDIYEVIRVMESKAKPWGSDEAYAGRTIQHVIALMHRVLNRAVKDRYLLENPCKLIEPHERPEIDDEAPRILTADEVLKILQAALDYNRLGKIRHALVFALALFAGLRKSEIIRLGWPDVDLKNGFLSVRKTGRIRRVKTKNAVRRIEMPDFLLDMFIKHWLEVEEQNDLNLVFIGRDNKTPLLDETIQKMQTQVLLRSGVWDPDSDDEEMQKKPTLHKLRHNYISVLHAEGVTLKYSTAQAGHKRASFQLDRYVHAVAATDQGTARAATQRHWGEALGYEADEA